MEKKNIVKSKTMQINTIAIILSYVLKEAGIDIPAEVQVAGLGVINYILRMVTKGSVSFT